MSVQTSPAQAGRLADPSMSPAKDPRTDPRMRAVLATYGMGDLAAVAEITRDAEPQVLTENIAAAEAGFEGLYASLPNELPGDESIETDYIVRSIDSRDGSPIELHIFKPAAAPGALPGLIYLHGGGMVILRTMNKVHERWCRDLASTGLVTIAVDYRNTYSDKSMNPFPRALDDCAAALRWIAEHRAEVGIGQIVLQGESGGANLALATALKAKRAGTIEDIAGVYAMVPYISGGYAWPLERKLVELPSLVENDGYFIDCMSMDLLVAAYDPTGRHAEDPLCWPYFATVGDLNGLPPHVVSVNELDPLRDEGIAYARRLAEAGVDVVGRVNLGVVHAADLIFRQALPSLYWATVRDIRRFAESLPLLP